MPLSLITSMSAQFIPASDKTLGQIGWVSQGTGFEELDKLAFSLGPGEIGVEFGNHPHFNHMGDPRHKEMTGVPMVDHVIFLGMFEQCCLHIRQIHFLTVGYPLQNSGCIMKGFQKLHFRQGSVYGL